MSQIDYVNDSREDRTPVCPILSVGSLPTGCIESSCALWIEQAGGNHETGCAVVLATHALHQQTGQA